MKRLILALILILTATSVSFGAVSDDIYVRKDVFDAKMEAFMNEIRGEFQVLNAKIDALSRRVDDNFNTLSKRIDDNYNALSKRIDDNYNTLSKRIDDNHNALEKRMDSLDKRVDDVRNGMYVLFLVLGIILSLPIFQKVYSSFKEWKASSQQSVTIEEVRRLIAEDVKRLIAENNAKVAS